MPLAITVVSRRDRVKPCRDRAVQCRPAWPQRELSSSSRHRLQPGIMTLGHVNMLSWQRILADSSPAEPRITVNDRFNTPYFQVPAAGSPVTWASNHAGAAGAAGAASSLVWDRHR